MPLLPAAGTLPPAAAGAPGLALAKGVGEAAGDGGDSRGRADALCGLSGLSLASPAGSKGKWVVAARVNMQNHATNYRPGDARHFQSACCMRYWLLPFSM